WDSTYDNGSLSTLSVACSDGSNGLYTKGYKTLSTIPNFPLVGAAPTIAGWNSPNCGKCFAVTYSGNTIYITGVDTSRSRTDFVLSKAALNKLTGGLADQLGRVTVTWSQLPSGARCG
ncbi:Cerato-platanin, partial [Terfezia boudieri ATCC MYA-4762]